MTFKFIEALATLLAIAQFSNQSPDIVRSYDPNQPQIMAQDLGRACRSLFSSPEFFSADEINKIVGDLQVQRAQAPAVQTPVEDVKPPVALQENPPAIAAEPESTVPPALADGDEEISDAGDPENNDTQSVSSEPNLALALSAMKVIEDLSFNQALDFWDGICRETNLQKVSFVNWNELAAKYNSAVRDLPDFKFLKGFKLPETSYIYDSRGEFMREFFGAQNHRAWVRLADIPKHVRQAFISIEDQNFYSHSGIEPSGILRGYLNYAKRKTVEGGSTISQQVIKNLVVGAKVDLDRKVKEMLVTKLVSSHLSKDEILELYLNLINLGRSSWGVEMAARNYFGKQVKDLDIAEGAFLAGATHKPNFYNPETRMPQIRDRVSKVIGRMLEDKAISSDQAQKALANDIAQNFIERQSGISGGSYFVSAVNTHLRERLGNDRLKSGGLRVRTTMHPELQKLTQGALQEGLFEYEQKFRRIKWYGPVTHVDLNSDWKTALQNLREEYDDISWELAVVLEKSKSSIKIGLADGSDSSLVRPADSYWAPTAYKQLDSGDIVFVQKDADGDYSLRVPSTVQGAAVAMDPQTGRVLALAGGFSATYSQFENGIDHFNRALNGYRQPGSTLKPFTYLAAAQAGIQPDTLVYNRAIYFPKVYENKQLKCRGWGPKNFSNRAATVLTMREGLAQSNNRVTARLLNAINPDNFMDGLNRVRAIAQEFGIYDDPFDCISFILGADETTPLRMATAYAMIANGGKKVHPRFVDAVQDMENNDIDMGYEKAEALTTVDEATVYQVKKMLNGVVEHGTATRIKDLADAVGGKTGTSNGRRDVWFVGFTNDLVIGIWVGYDQGAVLGFPDCAPSSQSTRCNSATGGSIALPIFDKIIRPSFDIYEPRVALNPPPESIEIRPATYCGGRRGFSVEEAFRIGTMDTRYMMVPYDPCARAQSEEAPVRKRKKKKVIFDEENSAPEQKTKRQKRKKTIFDLY